VDELASRYGISKRTIYRHFQSKEEIIEAVLQQFFANIEREVRLVLDSSANPVEKITNFIILISEKLRIMDPRVYGELQRYYPGIWEKVERFRGEKIKILIGIIVEGSREGYFKPINPTVVTASLVATVRGVINPIFVMENNLTLEETFQTVIDTFLYGIVAEKGRHM